jgi:membrane-bound ClpP family serine protease
MVLIIGLLLIGIVLLVLEILVLPGMIAGILGGVFLITGILWMYSSEGTTAGHITLAATFVLTFLAIYLSLKNKSWLRYGLKDTIDGHVNDVAILDIREGAEGRTLSALRPSGTIEIGDRRVEGQTTGEMIDAGTKVIVTKVLPNKIIVKIKTTEL